MFKQSILQHIVLVSVIVIVSTLVAGAQDNKLTADEIIARHLASFGSRDLIAKSVNRMAVGQADFTVLSTQKTATGKAVLASDGRDLALFSTFDLRDYRMERIGLFDNKVTVPIVEQGHRSRRWESFCRPMTNFSGSASLVAASSRPGSCIART